MLKGKRIKVQKAVIHMPDGPLFRQVPEEKEETPIRQRVGGYPAFARESY